MLPAEQRRFPVTR